MYHPTAGITPRLQAGRPGRQADFFTSTTFSPVFGELVTAAASSCSRRPAGGLRFCGNRRRAGRRILRGCRIPSPVIRPFRSASPSPCQPGRVFSNELFDASRSPRGLAEGRWRSWASPSTPPSARGRTAGTDRRARGPRRPSAQDLPGELPHRSAVAHGADAGTDRRPEVERLFLAFDYGKYWQELRKTCPPDRPHLSSAENGNDLLARPGKQDLTCHICWDWLEMG